jgi:MoaA/NifB/PqqE/SkfB family radical SAM enzyme
MGLRLSYRLRALKRRVRMARVIARAMQSRRHPVLAQIVPTRRCNLACTYCNEFDSTSAPVPLELMLARIDRLAALGTAMVDLSGGEPMLHPGLEQIVSRIRSHGMFAGLLTNGYLLTRARIAALNRAGLDRLQMSIDNVAPDGVSHKSLKVLDQKLGWLAEDASFDVNVNTVLGAGVRDPADALLIARRALSLGFGTSVGLIHDRSGQLAPLDPAQRQVYDELQELERGFYSHAHDRLFQENLIRGTANQWRCGAGARYLYVCEDGLVHWCSQQRGYPGAPLDRYGPEDLDREYSTVKSCAPHCTVSCVHRVALVDTIRERPLATLEQLGASTRAAGRRPPLSVGVLSWMFVTGSQKELFRRLALRALNASRTH